MTRALFLVSTLLVAVNRAPAAEPASSASAPISGIATQQPLTGTLFYSGNERARLDKARRTGSELDTDAPALRPPLVISGVVKRSDGSTSVWIDGSLVDPVSETIASKLSSSSVGHPDSLRLATGERLRVTDRTTAKPSRAKSRKRASNGQGEK